MNSKYFKKRIHFLYTQREMFFPTYRGVYFFRCGNFLGYFTWPCTDISKNGNNLRKWCLNLFSFPLRGSNIKSEKNVTWKNVSYSVWCLLQCKLNKKINYLEENSLTSNFHRTFVNDYQVMLLVKIFLFKLNNRNSRKTSETYSILTIKTPEQC